ncbi:adenylate/guanylate cyclase domain-containing protein [Sediminispirochaeta bajacaliforniensis]|uniref:adenylate/guanylate cyclase domain-containing protein n=1 Tax=Sediminispirochaeta bajacaliforniensis TaxID=148 RepID=UPI00036BCCDA|nr:adenylate/guanylate cyclase domain-containing protein [Sediminispirochaeta bajacaliforniensis]
MMKSYVFGELVRAGSRLSDETRYTSQISILVEQAIDVSRSSVAALFAYSDPENPSALLRNVYQRGDYEIPNSIDRNSESVAFVEECGESLILHDRDRPFFSDAFLHPDMRSGIILPLFTPRSKLALLYLNSIHPRHYMQDRFLFLDSLSTLAGGMLRSSLLYRELDRQLKYTEALERYQESIFSSMTDLLITTDESGAIHYFNRAAVERFGLDESAYGKSVRDLFSSNLSKAVLSAIAESDRDGKERPGIQGIAKGIIMGDGRKEDIDFALTIAPLRGKRGRKEGLTLLFTDQSRERKLQDEMKVAVEERRVIKNMFSRYLSGDIVQALTEHPELVRPGGAKKIATVFFADIRGYTSFSESKEPEYIIEVLNEYFSQAVEVVIKHRGYIDKFIGDCIMAAWGVPVFSDEQDAISAVSCAVEIQELVKSKKRTFFTGAASKLSIGIGMHTGRLVAGNLGSNRRMDYSVIGDTVNVAARLEGVAGKGEVIITEDTRSLIGERFKLKELEPVKVKGKEKPIHIFSVLKQVS